VAAAAQVVPRPTSHVPFCSDPFSADTAAAAVQIATTYLARSLSSAAATDSIHCGLTGEEDCFDTVIATCPAPPNREHCRSTRLIPNPFSSKPSLLPGDGVPWWWRNLGSYPLS